MASFDIKSVTGGLDPKIVERAKGCKTPEELLQLAEDEGITLPDELLGSVAGGTDPGAEAVGNMLAQLIGSC